MSAIAGNRTNRTTDRRVVRTQSAIVLAFNRLILERGYPGLTPGEVAAEADVGRSTFYEHFAGLDDLLARTLAPVLTPFAQGCFEAAMPEAASRAALHLWDNRRLGRALLAGDAYPVVQRSFAALFLSALAQDAKPGGKLLEPELIAAQLAAGQLAVLSAWLSGRSSHSALQIAVALHAGGRGMLAALTVSPAG